MTQPTTDTFFGTPASAAGLGLKFPTIGTEHTGTITAVNSPEPIYDKNTSSVIPGKFQVRIAMQMGYTDPNVEDDDGIRYLFVKSGMTRSVADALKEKNASIPEVGGKLRVKFTEEVTVPNSTFPAKRYEAEYWPPAAGQTPTGQFFSATGQTATPNAAPFAPEKPPSLDQAAWDAMDASTKAAVANTFANMPPF